MIKKLLERADLELSISGLRRTLLLGDVKALVCWLSRNPPRYGLETVLYARSSPSQRLSLGVLAQTPGSDLTQ
jgi:hypothetical protein